MAAPAFKNNPAPASGNEVNPNPKKNSLITYGH
jgi:hypothetical protein